MDKKTCEERIAEAVAKEREACAETVKRIGKEWHQNYLNDITTADYSVWAWKIEQAIRARGDK